MMPFLTGAELAALKTLLAAATPGPLTHGTGDRPHFYSDEQVVCDDRGPRVWLSLNSGRPYGKDEEPPFPLWEKDRDALIALWNAAPRLLEMAAASQLAFARGAAEAIKVDKTGLSFALDHIRRWVRGWTWVRDGEWASYEDEKQTALTMRREFTRCLSGVEEIAEAALKESGQRADAAYRLAHPRRDAALEKSASPAREVPPIPEHSPECRQRYRWPDERCCCDWPERNEARNRALKPADPVRLAAGRFLAEWDSCAEDNRDLLSAVGALRAAMGTP